MRADKQKIARLLKTARGQIDGVLRMVEEDQYCIDISNQIMAASEARISTAGRGRPYMLSTVATMSAVKAPIM